MRRISKDVTLALAHPLTLGRFSVINLGDRVYTSTYDWLIGGLTRWASLPNITAPNGLYFIEDSEAWQAVSVGSMRNIESHAARARSTPSPSLPAPVAMSSLSRPRQASRRGSCHAVATVASSPNGRILHPHGPHWTSLPLHHGIESAWTHTHPWMGGDPIALGDCALLSNLHTATRLDSL